MNSEYAYNVASKRFSVSMSSGSWSSASGMHVSVPAWSRRCTRVTKRQLKMPSPDAYAWTTASHAQFSGRASDPIATSSTRW